MHDGAIIIPLDPGVVCLEGQGISHLAVQRDGVTVTTMVTTTTIARGDLLALGTSTTRDNGHIAILLRAVTTIA